MVIKKFSIDMPADVPRKAEKEYRKNYATITKNTGHLFVFACDQKMEHLNTDFYGQSIHLDALSPEHLFTIANAGSIGAMATNVGLIARYGAKYPKIPYIAKLNGKTNLFELHEQGDPFSNQLWDIEQVLALKKEKKINIVGIGYALYIGGSYEPEMLSQATQIINEAHEHGLITLTWIYARGRKITDDTEPTLIAGLAGLATTLGSDFVKIKPPHDIAAKTSVQSLRIATETAGNTKVICSGGHKIKPELFFEQLYEQLHVGNTAGCATGRNIFQNSTPQAITMTRAIAAIVYENKKVEEALKLFQGARR